MHNRLTTTRRTLRRARSAHYADLAAAAVAANAYPLHAGGLYPATVQRFRRFAIADATWRDADDHRADRFACHDACSRVDTARRFLFRDRSACRSMATAVGGRPRVGGDAEPALVERRAVRRGGGAVLRGGAARSVL